MRIEFKSEIVRVEVINFIFRCELIEGYVGVYVGVCYFFFEGLCDILDSDLEVGSLGFWFV